MGLTSIGGLPSMSLGYSNLAEDGTNSTNGNNWFDTSLPTLTEAPDGNTFVYTGLPRRKIFFAKTNEAISSAKYFSQAILRRKILDQENSVIGGSGRAITFHDASAGYLAGKPKYYVMPNGDRYEYSYDEQGRILSLTRLIGEKISGYFYSYNLHSHKIEETTLRVQDCNVRRIRYIYYSEDEIWGAEGDLKYLLVDSYDPCGATWHEVQRVYYRYYIESSAQGFRGGLQYRVDTKGFEKMLSDGLNPETATADEISLYAETYYEYYEENRRVKYCRKNGVYGYSYTYEDGPEFAGSFDVWTLKTIQVLPDGNIITSYSSNRMMIAQVFTDVATEGTWNRYFGRDDLGRVTLYADTSAIVQIDPNAAPIAILRENHGLIYEYSWHSKSLLATISFRIGTAGSPSKLSRNEYIAQYVDGVPIYMLSLEANYRQENDEQPSETSYGYMWEVGSYTPRERKTIFPVIPVEQNGTGIAAEQTEIFDSYGQVIWFKNALGIINRYSYDIATFTLVQKIEDVNTSLLNAPWLTPAGAGLHLISDYKNDLLGRRIEERGPLHEAIADGGARLIRKARWVTFDASKRQETIANGFFDCCSGTNHIIDPVRILRKDGNGNLVDEIQSRHEIEFNTSTQRACACFEPDDRLVSKLPAPPPQETWTRWRHRVYDLGDKLMSEHVYIAIPSFGLGQKDINYVESITGYDSMGRKDYIKAPGGTITRTMYTAQGWVWRTYVGTKEEAEPGSGNMSLIEERTYDNNEVSGPGNLTAVRRFQNAAEFKDTLYTYDERNRLLSVSPGEGFTDLITKNNQGQTTKLRRQLAEVPYTLLAQVETNFDAQARVYMEVKYAVENGQVENNTAEMKWYDAVGNVIKWRAMGAEYFEKNTYDGLNRVKLNYLALNVGSNDLPNSVMEDIVVLQQEMTYDAGSNLIFITKKQRFHDENTDAVGPLQTTVATPKARSYFASLYWDPLGRKVAVVNYGTNGGAIPLRTSEIPLSTPTTLVTGTSYNYSGEEEMSIDANGIVTHREYDAAGRVIRITENS